MSGETNSGQADLGARTGDGPAGDGSDVPTNLARIRARGDLALDRRVAALVTNLERTSRTQAGRMELGVADMRILWMFSDGRARTLKEIGVELSLEQSTVNRQINSAISSGLLQRTREPGSTAHLIAPTDEGRAAYERDVETSLTAFREGLAVLGDRAEEFLSDFTAFVAAYEQAVLSGR